MRLGRGLVLSSLAVAAALTGVACAGEAAPQAAVGGRGGGQAAPVPVTVGIVAEKAMPLEIRVIGTAEPHQTVSVRAQITGQLTSVDFTEGDEVRAGQVLFTLDRRSLDAALQQAEANLAKDLAQAANAKATARRYQDLQQRGIATREQVDTTATAASALEATVGADRAAVENTKIQLQYATIASPISGRTGQLMVHNGNLVRANDTIPLVVINEITPINVTFAIPEAQLAGFKRYMAEGTLHVEAQAPDDTAPPAAGRITFVDNAVDQTTGTIKVKGAFPNQSGHLWPGQFVNVVVRLATDQHAIVVPSMAVQTGQQGQYVFVVTPDKTVELRPVGIARPAGAETVIKDGLTPGETVVTDGQLRLVPGSRVNIKGGGGNTAS